MKKFWKIAAWGAGGIFVLLVVAGIYIFQRLPSAASIGAVFKGPEAEAQVAGALNEADPGQATVSGGQTAAAGTLSGDSSQSTTDQDEVEQAALDDALVKDLTSPQKPLSDFCSSLKNAKDGAFDQDELSDAFAESLDENTRDPRIQAVKPILRYVMRLPKMADMMNEAQAAAERDDESFLDKAEFYKKAYSAFTEMNEHKPEIESVMDRSYLLLGLNKLMAKKPELLNDPRILNYCGDVELSFNQARPVDFDNEKKDFLNVLNDLNVSPKDIGFDTNYKSQIRFDFSGQALTFEGGWLNDLVRTDVEMGTGGGGPDPGGGDRPAVKTN